MGELDESVRSTVTLSTDWETFARLGCGRIPPASAAVVVEGDRDLTERILARMTVTP